MSGELRTFLDTAAGKRDVSWLQVTDVRRGNSDRYYVYHPSYRDPIASDGLTVYLAQIADDDWEDGELRTFDPPLSVMVELRDSTLFVLSIDNNRLAVQS